MSSSQCFGRRWRAACAAIVLLLVAGGIGGAAWAESSSGGGGGGGANVSDADKVQYEQKAVEAQMQELQERMYHLADLTRQTEPDDAARLLLAVRKAREDLILEQMHDVLDQLSHENLATAADEQTQVLEKLEELKKLLTSTDLDLQMQLARLHALNAAIAKLDKNIAEEKRQQAQSKKFADNPNAQKYDAQQKQQAQNRQATDALAQSLKDLGAPEAAAAATLGSATRSMNLAEGRLGAGQPGDAADQQSQAVKSMKDARDQLEKERQKILEELQMQVRKQVIENLQEMLDRQKSVRGGSEAAEHLPSADRETILRVKRLAAAEAAIVRICDQTLDLINQTEFSVALPPALSDLRVSMQSVADRLGAGSADATVVTDEKQIEHDLADLLDTFKQLAANPGPPGNCNGNCKGNKNKLLAELKVLRLLQSRVNGRTVAVDAQRAADPPSAPLSPDMQQQIESLRDGQSAIQQATDKIHQELSGS